MIHREWAILSESSQIKELEHLLHTLTMWKNHYAAFKLQSSLDCLKFEIAEAKDIITRIESYNDYQK